MRIVFHAGNHRTCKHEIDLLDWQEAGQGGPAGIRGPRDTYHIGIYI